MTDINRLLEKGEPKTPTSSIVGSKIKELMDKPERLRLICNKCNKEWMEKRPVGYHVRYEKNNNFLINQHSPYDKKLFKCPKCKSKKNIGRLSVTNVNIKKRPAES